jgi:hypothetical protein
LFFQWRTETIFQVTELEQLLRSEKQVATLELVYKKSEDRKSKQVRELQEMDKQSTVYIADLKGTIKQLEADIVQLERQKNVHGAQMTAVRVIGGFAMVNLTAAP